MAVEYDLESDTEADLAEIREFFAAAIEGDAGPDGTVFRNGMYVMTYRLDPEDEESTIEHFGFRHRITATYRFSNLADPAVRDHNTALMVRSVLQFTERFGGHGVLLFNGEEATIQWTPDEVVFGSDWPEWTEVRPVIPLLTGHAIGPLPQPLL